MDIVSIGMRGPQYACVRTSQLARKQRNCLGAIGPRWLLACTVAYHDVAHRLLDASTALGEPIFHLAQSIRPITVPPCDMRAAIEHALARRLGLALSDSHVCAQRKAIVGTNRIRSKLASVGICHVRR